MKLLLTILFLTFFIDSFGQFAIVHDKDGFLNVREDGVLNSKVLDQLKNGHLIYCFEDKGNWTSIDYTNKNKELSGYVYKDRYKLISNFLHIPVATKTENKVVLEKDTINITITQSKFDKNTHKFQYFKEESGLIELIDNKNYWGTDGYMPIKQFSKVEIKIGQKTIYLPKYALEGLYEPDINSAEVYYDDTSNTFYIQTMNSDGSGAYFALWRIEGGVYKDRLVTAGF